MLLMPDANTEGQSSTPSDDKAQADASSATETQDDKAVDGIADIVRKTIEKESSSDSVEEDASKGQSPTLTDEAKEEKEVLPGDDKTEKKGEEKPDEPKADSPEDKKEELPPFHKHPRWVQVNSELKEVTSKVAKLEPLAKDAEGLMTFCKTSGIDHKQFNELMEVGALINSNPAEAIVKVKAFLKELEGVAGDTIPDDLSKEVEEGLITEARAKEISRLRASEKFKASRAQATEKERELAGKQQEIQAIENGVNAWVQSQMAKDPAFSKKYEMLSTRFMQKCNEAVPKNPSEAIKIAEEALAWTNAQLGIFAPKPQKKKVLSSSDSSSTKDGGEEESLADVVRNAAAKHES